MDQQLVRFSSSNRIDLTFFFLNFRSDDQSLVNFDDFSSIQIDRSLFLVRSTRRLEQIVAFLLFGYARTMSNESFSIVVHRNFMFTLARFVSRSNFFFFFLFFFSTSFSSSYVTLHENYWKKNWTICIAIPTLGTFSFRNGRIFLVNCSKKMPMERCTTPIFEIFS